MGGMSKDPGPRVCETEYLRELNNDAHPDTTHTFLWGSTNYRKARDIKNFYNLVFSYYGDLAFAMNEELPAKLRRNVRPKVFGAGYDWRQSNYLSAERLSLVVDDACDACGGEQAILIAHSMGGLVSRLYCAKGGEKKVRALFLIASPTLGAPEAYSLLKAGINTLDAKDLLLRKYILKLNVDQSRDFLRVHGSGYELVPTTIYGKNVDDAWLTFDESSTGYPERDVVGSNPLKPVSSQQFSNCAVGSDKLYGDLYTGFTEAPATRVRSRAHVEQASRFHGELARVVNKVDKVYMHPHTYCIYTGNMKTTTGATVTLKRVDVDQQTRDVTAVLRDSSRRDTNMSGDAVVPTVSARPSNPNVEFDGTWAINKVEHSDLPNHEKVIKYLLLQIPLLV
jgi:pimeloyl-ACP methyl ester carboxylesterase